MPTTEELERVEELFLQGISQGKIAKEMGRSQSTIHRWLDSLGLLDGSSPDQSGTKKAIEAKANYDRERRLTLNNKFFKKIEEMLDAVESPSDLRSLATPYGVAEDKRHLLEPPNQSGNESGLESMREAMRAARKNDMETATSDEQSG